MVTLDTEESMRAETPGLLGELEELLFSTVFEDSYVGVQTSLALSFGIDSAEVGSIRCEKMEDIKRLRGEFQGSLRNPNLINALGDWGYSRSYLSGQGKDIHFNAGIVHYFEYRALLEKARRFKSTDKPSIQGFIDYTNALKSFLDNPVPVDNSSVLASAQIAGVKLDDDFLPIDEIEERKTVVLTVDGLFVVGFQGNGENSPKLITAIPNITLRAFIGSINEDLTGSTTTRARLNKLGPDKVLVYFAKGEQHSSNA